MALDITNQLIAKSESITTSCNDCELLVCSLTDLLNLTIVQIAI